MAEKLGVVIYTNTRVDDAKINMELVRGVWEGPDPVIVHAYNGDPDKYPEKYLEDELVVTSNPGHFQGAADLIDSGLEVLEQEHPEVGLAVVLAADTWITRPDVIATVTESMREKGERLASSCWGMEGQNDPTKQGLATDFFIADPKWGSQNGMLPLDYSDFENPPKSMLLRGQVMVEKLLMKRLEEAVTTETGETGKRARVGALERLHRIVEREPVHSGTIKGGRVWVRNFVAPKIGLIATHDPEPKKKLLEELGIKEGKNIRRLLESDDLSYFNNPD